MLEYGNLFNNTRTFFPPVLSNVFIIPETRVLTLFSAPYTYLAGVPGFLIVPEQCQLVRVKGTAYTLGAATTFTLGWTGTTSWTTNLGVAAVFTTVNVEMVTSIENNLTVPIIPNSNLLGVGQEIRMNGGNLTNGSGVIYIYLTYRLWPNGNPS